MCQQSPSFGRAPTGATSAHHLVTPTSVLFAPIAHKIAVALGASETIRWPCSASFFMLPQKHSRRVAALPTERGRSGRALTPLSECAGLRLLGLEDSRAPFSCHVLFCIGPAASRFCAVFCFTKKSRRCRIPRHDRQRRLLLVQQKTAQKRSEEHTSELQSPVHLVCRRPLEKKK